MARTNNASIQPEQAMANTQPDKVRKRSRNGVSRGDVTEEEQEIDSERWNKEEKQEPLCSSSSLLNTASTYHNNHSRGGWVLWLGILPKA